jgi:uncharacterized protein
MLMIDLQNIPPEGLDVDEELLPAALHLGGAEDFELEAGGRLRCHVGRGEDDLVQVTGELAATLGLECSRCLERFLFPVSEKLDLIYLPASPADTTGAEQAEDEEDICLTEQDMVVAYHREGCIDLGETVRGQLLLALPMKRLCRDDCRGLCEVCGTNRNVASCQCPQASTDFRLAPLARLLERAGRGQDRGPAHGGDS